MQKEMEKFLATSEDFKSFVEKNMKTYNHTLEQELQSPITVEYYKSLQKGGCNYKEVQNNDV